LSSGGKREETTIAGIVYTPGSTVKNKTGGWRAFRPVFDKEKCKKCLQCAIFCPEGIIKVGKAEGASCDLDFCKGCGICASLCKFGAIKMVKEER
jgi:pyruvate ferredoxin oxidoreductase delta subunit